MANRFSPEKQDPIVGTGGGKHSRGWKGWYANEERARVKRLGTIKAARRESRQRALLAQARETRPHTVSNYGGPREKAEMSKQPVVAPVPRRRLRFLARVLATFRGRKHKV